MSYEVPSEEREQRKARKERDANRKAARFSPTYSTQADSEAIGAGSKDLSVGVITGNLVMNPEIHIVSIQISWTGATGTLEIGDIVDTTASAWQGKFLLQTSGNSTAGTGIFEPVNSTAFTNVAQTLNVGATWTGATYTTSSLVEGQIVITSASLIIQERDNTNPTIRTIHGAKNDGQFTTVKPIEGVTLTLVSGGNIDIDSDITVEDTTFNILQFHEDNITPDANGNWSSGGGGGGAGVAGTIFITPTNEITSPTASENVDLSLFQHYIFHLSANLELTLINPPTPINRAEQFILEFIQDGVGGRTITVTNTIHPSVPILDGTALSRSVIVGFTVRDFGSNVRHDMYLVGS